MAEKTIQIHEKILPGWFFLRRRQWRSGIRSLILCGLPLFIFISVLDKLILTVQLIAFAIFLFITDNNFSASVLFTGLIEHGIAVLTMIVWMAYSWILHYRMVIQNTQSSPESLSPWKQTFVKMMRNPMQRWVFRVLTGLILIVLLNPWIRPYDPLEQKDLSVTRLVKPFRPIYYLNTEIQHNLSAEKDQTTIEQFMKTRKNLLEPANLIIYADSIAIHKDTVFYKQGMSLRSMPVRRLRGGTIDRSTGIIRSWFGRDSYGRDVFSRLLSGARISFVISVLSVTLSVLIGVLIGAVAGYAGGITDTLLMRFTDMMLAFPVIFLILLLMGLWGPSATMLIFVIGLSGWMGIARLVRAEVMAIKEKEYILAARALGFRPARILIRHILPNAMTPVIVSATLRIGTVMMVEAGLSFLGLGIQPPMPSWGNMIHEGRSFLPEAWWISAFPGMALVATVILFNILGDGLRDAWDRKLN